MNGRLIERERLSAAERRAMRELMDRYFLGVTPAVFERDLAEKDYAILLTGDEGELCGFTTFAVVPFRCEGGELWAVYSGDTIVDRGARGSFALAATWIDSIRCLRTGLGGGRMVWLLICSSPRTYRFLPLFFRDFQPRAGAAAPPATERLIATLAWARYGDAYDAASGIVRLADPQPLRPEPLPAGEDGRDEEGRDRVGRDGHDRCFLAANPGYLEGDELVCFTELCDDNLTPAGRRMVRAGERMRGAAVNGSAGEAAVAGRCTAGARDRRPAVEAVEDAAVAPEPALAEPG